MMIVELREDLVADAERRLAPRDLLARLGQRQADGAQARNG